MTIENQNYNSKGNRNENQANSVEKTMLIAEVLSRPPYEYKTATIAAITGINRTTVHRALQTLLSMAFVSYDEETKKYRIGPATYHIGMSYIYNKSFTNEFSKILNELAAITKESVGLAVIEGEKIISLMEIEVPQPMKFFDFPGKYYPINKGCYGKCLMAFQPQEFIDAYFENHPDTFEKTCPNTISTKEELLAEYETIRKNGYAYSIDEVGQDVIGVGIPLFDTKGRIQACAGVAFYRGDNWKLKLEQLRDIFLKYQKKLEFYLP